MMDSSSGKAAAGLERGGLPQEQQDSVSRIGESEACSQL